MKGVPPAHIDLTSNPVTDSENVIWGLINRCWMQEPEGRPKCREILDKLNRKGIFASAADDQKQIAQETRCFRDTMRKNEEILINLDAIETILNTVCMLPPTQQH